MKTHIVDKLTKLNHNTIYQLIRKTLDNDAIVADEVNIYKTKYIYIDTENENKCIYETNYILLDYFKKYIEVLKLCLHDYIENKVKVLEKSNKKIEKLDANTLKDLIYNFLDNNSNYNASIIMYYIELLEPFIMDQTVNLVNEYYVDICEFNI